MAAAATKVVGIGASAGGVEAFRRFFQQMPPESGLAFVIVVHLAPDRESLLPEILAGWTQMPVHAANDDALVLPNNVYVVPAGVAAVIRQARIKLRPLAPEEHHLATVIDVFFDALAADLGARAIGVILSGTGHDGALGLKAVRKAGGMTIAQGSDGTIPQFAGMPDSAIATGAVDVVVPVDAIPGVLLAARSIGSGLEQPAVLPAAAVNQARLDICQALQDRIGHDFGITRTRRSCAASTAACRCSTSRIMTSMFSAWRRIGVKASCCSATC